MRRKAPKVGFADLPPSLRDLSLDAPAALKEARAAWLQRHGLAFADFLAWKRSRDPLAKLRPPSRRKFMSPKQLAEFDARREQRRGTPMVTSDEKGVVGVLIELPDTGEEFTLLQAARVAGAVTMLRRSGFDLILLPVGAAAPIVKKVPTSLVAASRMEGGRMNTNTIEGTEEVCAACRTIPITHLALDLDEPTAGWAAMLAERGVAVEEDDLGRPSIPRQVLGDLLSEHVEREALVTAQRAELATRKDPIPAGVPAIEGLTSHESMVAAGGVVTSVGGVRTTEAELPR